MKIHYLLGLCLFLLSCEKVHQNYAKITGSWKLTLQMFNDEQLINELHGDIIFFADYTAKITLNEGDTTNTTDYNWYQQPNYIVLVNQDSNFPLPYYIHSHSDKLIELSQTKDVKMTLLR